MDNPQAWIALFPHISDAGNGVLDRAALVNQGVKLGVQHFLLERDLAPKPLETLRYSYGRLAELQLR